MRYPGIWYAVVQKTNEDDETSRFKVVPTIHAHYWMGHDWYPTVTCCPTVESAMAAKDFYEKMEEARVERRLMNYGVVREDDTQLAAAHWADVELENRRDSNGHNP